MILVSKWFEQLKFKLQGVSIFCVHVSDLDTQTGRVNTLRIVGDCKNRPNSIIETWNTVGWCKNGEGMINFIGEDGVKKFGIVVSESGGTTNLYAQPSDFPNREQIVGKAATIDDITEAMDLNKSMKQLAIGLVIGILLGWLIIGPLFSSVGTKVMS